MSPDIFTFFKSSGCWGTSNLGWEYGVEKGKVFFLCTEQSLNIVDRPGSPTWLGGGSRFTQYVFVENSEPSQGIGFIMIF